MLRGIKSKSKQQSCSYEDSSDHCDDTYLVCNSKKNSIMSDSCCSHNGLQVRRKIRQNGRRQIHASSSSRRTTTTKLSTKATSGMTSFFSRVVMAFLSFAPILLTGGQRYKPGSYYSNVTLSANDGRMKALIYLPAGIHPEEDHFYWSTRFEHGSMVGPITRTTYDPNTKKDRTNTFYGTELWRRPHDPNCPECGAGFASEFGVGDDGAFCFYRCGWFGVDDVSNGVLGYREAKAGEAFLKIGVGSLIKGSCTACDSTDDYKFNSPYKFAELPLWHLIQLTEDSLVLEHEAHVNANNAISDNLQTQQYPSTTSSNTHYGYRLRKDITLHPDYLLMTSTLTNLGEKPFSTAWYSHHFFTCDSREISQGYSASLNLNGDRSNGRKLYEEPGVLASWATPIINYGIVSGNEDHINVNITRPIDDRVRIKAEFTVDDKTDGSFTLNACDTLIKEDITQLSDAKNLNHNPFGKDVSMYAYNLYIEKSTFSPEPQILIHLQPGQSKSWTQRVAFRDNYPYIPQQFSPSVSSLTAAQLLNSAHSTLSSSSSSSSTSSHYWLQQLQIFLPMVILCAMISLYVSTSISRRRRHQYSQIPDHQQQQQQQHPEQHQQQQQQDP